MNAKALLRAYLEQRRELGETELVLDSLDVDEVMRLLGATGRPRVADRPVPAQPSLRKLAEEIAGEDVKDWRDSLRQAGVNVDPGSSARNESLSPTAEPAQDMAFKKGIVISSG
ncbi:MAG TPA: hypothetical protein VFP26_09325, partial [Gemmatimonadaceae bacterium]|nr:hypothetical protein [Gemmatimonadaceae bacterium]